MQMDEPNAPISSRIGPYRILSQIGEGGMGAVYLAEQDHPNRQVALKVIRADAFSPQLLRRFEHEAEMLGRLQHPGIAQIYQAGTHTTAQGVQPYFAMEYVRGQTLDLYASEHTLGTRERLELAAKICDAVEHAHQKGVIHRDLKPGNILVTPEGQPKILDFGVARITDADVRTTTLHTDIGVLVGTLTYMSPEQASGDPDQLDTRSDVYSLGVVIFELLTGQLPYRIDRRMVPEAVRAIREEEPSRLSTHDRTLRGDVETIVAKSLEKDKARRYASASALASDIRRYLADEPIAARPPSAGYQLSKFARRNKVLVGGVAAFFLALVAGAIVATHQAIRARSAEKDAKEKTALVTAGLERATKAEKEALEQAGLASAAEKLALEQAGRANAAEKLALERLERAQIEQKKAEQSAAFLNSLFGGIDPYEAEGADTTLLRRILSAATERISSELAGQPEVEASIRHTLGEAYTSLALYADAESQLRRAEELALELYGADARQTLSTQHSIGSMLFGRGDHAAAIEIGRRTQERQARLFGPADPDSVGTRLALGDALTRAGRDTEAEALFREVLARADEFDLSSAQRDSAKLSLGIVLSVRRPFIEAEQLFLEVIASRRAELGPDHVKTLEPQGNLALVLKHQGRFEESEAIDREVLAGLSRILGPAHPQALNVQNNLAEMRALQGDLEGAESMLRECLATRRRVLGDRHPDVLRTLANLSNFFLEQGRLSEARTFLEEALEGQEAVLGEEHEDTVGSKLRMAMVLKEEHEPAEAAKLLAEVADHARRTLEEWDPELGRALYNLAGMLQDSDDDAQAEPVLREVLALREKHHWKDEPFIAAALNGLAKALESRGATREADELFAEALELRRRLGKADLAYSLADYGETLLRRGELERAEPLLRELCTIRSQVLRAGDWRIPGSQSVLGRCLAEQGRFAEAEPLLESACESLSADPDARPVVVNNALRWIVEMYEDWDQVEPGAGRAELAAKWRARSQRPQD